MAANVRSEYRLTWLIYTVKQLSPRTKPSAIERSSARRSHWMRLTRTIVLGTVAAAAGIVWLGKQYGIEQVVMLEFMAASTLFVGLLVVAGLVATLVLRGLKKLLRRDS